MEEEDVWDLDLDFTGNESEEEANPGSTQPEMTIAEIMEVRYLRAEKEKELVRVTSMFLWSFLTNLWRATEPFVAGTTRSQCATIKQHMQWSPRCRIIS